VVATLWPAGYVLRGRGRIPKEQQPARRRPGGSLKTR
jgi:hypothetical protein